MLKREIHHPAGTITHWTSDEKAHEALCKRLGTPEKIKLNAFERAGNRVTDRPTFRQKHENWPKLVDDNWPLYQKFKQTMNYDCMRKEFAKRLGISFYQANCLCHDIRAKYILKGKA